MAGSSCPHVKECVGRLGSTDLAELMRNMFCEVCRRGLGTTNLWLCVYPDCYMLGCAEGKSDHSSQHQERRPHHAIQLNVSNKRAWCYHCRAEVILHNNSPAVVGVLGTRLLPEPGENEVEQEASPAGLVGLSNLGNTCYMNAALQCLSNTPALTKYFLNCADLVPRDIKPNLGLAYAKLMAELWTGDREFVAPTGVLHAIKQAWPAFRGFQQHDSQEFLRCCMDQLHKELLEPVMRPEEEEDREEADSSQYESADSDSGVSTGTVKKRPRRETETAATAQQHRSIVTDIFDGALQSNVQCLTCNTVSKTRETFQDLSLPIPSSETVREGGRAGDEGWLSWAWAWLASWFYGADVSLLDCLECFFSADELKGDNMYRCEKCKMLRNGLKFSQVTKLPDTLCIHLKRFRHDTTFSSKIGTRVSFPLEGLDISRWVMGVEGGTYSLAGVICHHGSAGTGGHYTCYCLNATSRAWHHYDDSSVRQVEAGTVMNNEAAYVLFYRRDAAAELKQARLEVLHRLSRQQQGGGEESLLVSYIATAWLTKFYTMSDPGPVDNSSVICRHGAVQPGRASTAASLCTAVPSQVWRLLHSRYGGCAAVTSLAVCGRCEEEERAAARQKEYELSQFKLLHEEDRAAGESDRYCLAAAWFRDWEAWVCNKAREPPGPINNRSLVVHRASGVALRPNIDHYKFSGAIWAALVSTYGGGPEVVLAAEGGLRVSSPRPRPHRPESVRTEDLSLED